MNIRHASISLIVFLSILIGLTAAGCGDSTSKSELVDPTPDAGGDADTSPDTGDVTDGTPDLDVSDVNDVGDSSDVEDVEVVELGTLERASAQAFEVESGEVIVTSVRYLDADGTPQNDVPVRFEVIDPTQAGGAQYDFAEVNTGFRADDGVANGELETGRAAIFNVLASSDQASNTIEFQIKVTQRRVAVYEFTAVSDIELLEKDGEGNAQLLEYDEILIATYDRVNEDNCEDIENEIWEAGVDQEKIIAARPGGSRAPLIIEPIGEGEYDTARVTVTLPNSGLEPQPGDPADARPPLRYAVAFGYVGETVVGYDCVEMGVPGEGTDFFEQDVVFQPYATYPDVQDLNYDITTNLNLTSAIPDDAEEIVGTILEFLTDPATVLIDLIVDQLIEEDSNLDITSIISEIAGSVFDDFVEGTVVETITEVAEDVKTNLEEFEFDGKVGIVERPDKDGLLDGDNTFLLNILYVDLQQTPGVNEIVRQNIGNTFSAGWTGRVGISRQTADGVEYGLIIDPFSLDFAYGELVEILLVQVALNSALNKDFDDLGDVAAEYIECSRWIRDAACETVDGDQECDFWVDIAVTACEGARDFAVDFGRQQLLTLTTSTGDSFTLGTDVNAICEIYTVPRSGGLIDYKFGNGAGTLPPSDVCIWDGSLRYSSDSVEAIDGTFYIRP